MTVRIGGPGEIIDRAAATAEAAAGTDDPPDLAEFVRHYFANVADDDLEARGPDTLAEAARAHWRFAAARPPETALLRVYTPPGGARTDAATLGHTVVEIVTDDMPFLVDSVTMEIDRHDLAIHLVVHPIISVRREGSELRGLASADERDCVAESFIRVEIDRTTDVDETTRLGNDLRRVLDDVRVAGRDWRAMVEAMHGVLAQLEQRPAPVDAEELAETRALLEWMADDHFTYLGYREYELVGRPGDEQLVARAGTGLGLLGRNEGRPGSDSFARLPADIRAKAWEPTLLVVSKANSRATVHRPTYLDYVGIKKFNEQGDVEGEWRFLGLWTSSAYAASARSIPLLRRKVAEVLERAGFVPNSHDEKNLLQVLDSYPRDDLFQIDVDTLFEIAVSTVQLQERKRVKLFARRDDFRRFVSALVYLPRERYNTLTRMAITDRLVRAYGAISHEFQARVTESRLAQLHFVLRTDPTDTREVDTDALEQELAAATRSWSDELRDALVTGHGEERGLDLARAWSVAFPPGFQADYSPAHAVDTIAEIMALPPGGGMRSALGPPLERGVTDLELTLYVRGETPPLSVVLPVLGHMGVEVVEEHPYRVEPTDAPPVLVQRFGLRRPGAQPVDADRSRRFEECFAAALAGVVEDDGLNRLVLSAGLTAAEIAILRAYSRYSRQTGSRFGLGYVFDSIAEYPDIARLLVDLFMFRLDPRRAERTGDAERVEQAILGDLDDVTSLDHDRILRTLLMLVMATVRTNWFADPSPTALALKLDPTRVPDLPEPRPKHEIWVYATSVEGVHLRSDSVARGGIRWSDRPSDFRTEVLGLMKAQRVKNTVIVPAGAKGGFVVRTPNPSRDDVVGAYRAYISALLDMVDDRVDGETIVAPGIVRYDGDDVYLVVAADKGTATFSDIANEIAIGRGYWLGDAFASGGSFGYDHKKMGITAKGAWESVKRHFRGLGIDIAAEAFTAVGIGDMSGDVFGNGMLLSHTIRLVAAFDHRHVFLDPDPDPRASYRERERLFALPASSWADYDATKISEGGGVFSRTVKAVPISAQVRERLGLADTVVSLTPSELVRAILLAPVDLLWNGGVGTFVKASHERDADVGDKANDALRVNGRQLRCRVVAEGGNLGLTQAGRVEFALLGGLVNTDFIDNSAGVDTSDHEVNIKILLDQAVRTDLITLDERNDVFESMTDEVAALVLRTNYRQNRAIANARAQAYSMEDVHARYLRALEQRGLLNRALEALPDDEVLLERRATGAGLTGPEIALLVSYTKIALEEEMRASDLPDDADFFEEIVEYFPPVVRTRFDALLDGHPLKRGIIATMAANRLVNAAGTTFVFRMQEETGATIADITRARRVAREIFELPGTWAEIDTLDNAVAADLQTSMYLEIRKLVERASRWLLRHRRRPLPVRTTLDFFGPGVRTLAPRLPDLLGESERAVVAERRARLVEAGVPDALAGRVAIVDQLFSALDIVDLALRAGLDVERVAGVYLSLGETLHLDWLLERILALPRADRWQALARTALRDDAYAVRRELTSDVIQYTSVLNDDAAACRTWLDANAAIAAALAVIDDLRNQGADDLSTLTVALRELRNLAQPT